MENYDGLEVYYRELKYPPHISFLARFDVNYLENNFNSPCSCVCVGVFMHLCGCVHAEACNSKE